MKKLVVLITFLVIIFIGGACIFWGRTKRSAITGEVSNQGSLILKRSVEWGPCPKRSKCHLDTYLYETGKIYFVGDVSKEAQLSNKDINTITKAIRQSGIFEKDCTGPATIDYFVEYEINLDGKSKHLGIGDTGCKKEMDSITETIDALYTEYEK